MCLEPMFYSKKADMKKYLIMLLYALLCCVTPVQAQQQQMLKRSKSIFLFPEFVEGKVKQSFGRFAKAKVNIYLKDASLMYMENDKIMRAYTDNIFGVVFGDSLEFVKIDNAMARVVASKGYNSLLCVTTVNMARYREEESGGTGLDFFELEDSGVFMNLNQDRRDEDMGIPLQDKYYFSAKGFIFPANETAFKKAIKKEQQQPFKVLMENRFWSWKDPESLTMLLDFLPE